MKWSPVRAGLSLLVASVLAASLAVVQSAPASADSLVWARQFAGSSFNQGFGVAMDSTGVYVAGQYSSNNTWDAFLKKYDVGGTQLWSRYRFCQPGREQGATVTAGDSGVYAIADFDKQRPPFFSLLSRYEPDGTHDWNVRLSPDLALRPDSPGSAVAQAVASDESGVYVGGDVNFPLPGGGWADRPFIVKFDPLGNELWSHRFGIGNGISDIAVGTEGVAVVGTTGYGSSPTRGRDPFVRVYTTTGELSWKRRFDTPESDFGANVSFDSNGLYVAGFRIGSTYVGFVRRLDLAGDTEWRRLLASTINVEVTGACSPQVGDGVMIAGWGGDLSGAPSQTTEGFVRTYDANGKVVATTYIASANPVEPGGLGPTFLNDIAASNDGVYVTGSTDGTFPGQWKHAFEDDAFVARVA